VGPIPKGYGKIASRKRCGMIDVLQTVVIEVTNRCNLRCVQCPSRQLAVREKIKDNPPFIEYDLFKNIVDQFAIMQTGRTKFVSPQFQGEPLLHPRFIEMCQYIDFKGMGIGFTTNGVLLDKNMVDGLLKIQGMSNIGISIDGSNKEIDEAIRVGSDYNKVISNLEYLLSQITRRDKNSYLPNITLSYCRTKQNENDLGTFIQQWINNPKIKLITSSYAANEKLIPWKFYYNPERTLCKTLWNFMIVLTNGDVVPCCRDYLYELKMGNLIRQSLNDVWNGVEYNKLRELHSSGNCLKNSVCNSCATWMINCVPSVSITGKIRQTTYPFHTILEKIQ
jgi:radical SAM protein with 4Fe4S-binding SPASM domain